MMKILLSIDEIALIFLNIPIRECHPVMLC